MGKRLSGCCLSCSLPIPLPPFPEGLSTAGQRLGFKADIEQMTYPTHRTRANPAYSCSGWVELTKYSSHQDPGPPLSPCFWPLFAWFVVIDSNLAAAESLHSQALQRKGTLEFYPKYTSHLPQHCTPGVPLPMRQSS